MLRVILLLFCTLFITQAHAQKEVIYHVFQRSFFDSNADGHGDLEGIRQKLDYLQQTGITSIMLTPLYTSDFYHSYFATDFEKIDPKYGTFKEYRDLVQEVHRRGMKIYQDVEMQYVAGKHPWFTDSYQNPKSAYSQYIVYEIENYLKYLIESRLGYWLHFALIAAAAYMLFILYKNNRDGAKKLLADKGFLPWVAVFLLVYFASSELMLHWLVISLEPIKIAGGPNGGFNVEILDRIDAMRTQVVKTGYPVLWGVLAGMLLYTGIKKQMKNIRIVALVLLGLTIAKLFIYDIRNASETGKIIAFILLGVLVLIISFVYQKLKLLVTADKPATETATDAEHNSLPDESDETI